MSCQFPQLDGQNDEPFKMLVVKLNAVVKANKLDYEQPAVVFVTRLPSTAVIAYLEQDYSI